MAWTQADADKLRAAILALACGEAVQRVEYEGPPRRSVIYHPSDLDKMRALLAVMEADIGRAKGTPSYRLATYRKDV